MDPLLHLELVVKPGVDPIAGWLLPAGGNKIAFSGYLEFMAVLERVAQGPVPEPEAQA